MTKLLQSVADLIKARHPDLTDVSVEYPGYIEILLASGHSLAFGDVNATWQMDVANSDQDTIDGSNSHLLRECTDLEMVAAALEYCLRQTQAAGYVLKSP